MANAAPSNEQITEPQAVWFGGWIRECHAVVKSRFGSSFRGVISPIMERLERRAKADEISVVKAFEREYDPILQSMSVLELQIVGAALLQIYIDALPEEEEDA